MHYKSLPTRSAHQCRLSYHTCFVTDMEEATHAKQISTIFGVEKKKQITAVIWIWRQCFGSSCIYYQGQKSEPSISYCYASWRIKAASSSMYQHRKKPNKQKKEVMNECNHRSEYKTSGNILGVLFLNVWMKQKVVGCSYRHVINVFIW